MTLVQQAQIQIPELVHDILLICTFTPMNGIKMKFPCFSFLFLQNINLVMLFHKAKAGNSHHQHLPSVPILPVCLKGRETQSEKRKKKERELSSIHWFTLQMPATPGQGQAPGDKNSISWRWQKLRSLSYNMLPSRVHYSKKLYGKQKSHHSNPALQFLKWQ